MARFGTGSLCDLPASIARILPQLHQAIEDIAATADFVLGKSVEDLEAKLARHTDANHCVTVANGTDAIKLSLIAIGATPQSLVLCPSFTFQACGNAILDTGARLGLVDVDPDTMTVTAATLEETASTLTFADHDRIFLLGVDLFGLPCATDELIATCDALNITFVVDAAQSFGAQFGDDLAIGRADLACTSFFPSKPLGGLGDGGAIFCREKAVAERLRSLRNHGVQDYGLMAVRPGYNSRLDSFQAAALLALLDYERSDCMARRRAAAQYRAILEPNGFQFQAQPPNRLSASSSMTVRIGAGRDVALKVLRAEGIECQVFYRYPLHRHPAFASAVNFEAAFPSSDALSNTVLSMPIHPFLDEPFFQKIERVAAILPRYD